MEIQEFKTELKRTEAEISRFVSDKLLDLEKRSDVSFGACSMYVNIDKIMCAGQKATYHYCVNVEITPDLRN
jgi:hypothetical protein